MGLAFQVIGVKAGLHQRVALRVPHGVVHPVQDAVQMSLALAQNAIEAASDLRSSFSAAA